MAYVGGYRQGCLSTEAASLLTLLVALQQRYVKVVSIDFEWIPYPIEDTCSLLIDYWKSMRTRL